MRFLWALFLVPVFCFASDKILVFIIASDQLPVYQRLQECWQCYMNSDPEHIESYFLRADPQLNMPYKIEGNTVWIKTDEGGSSANASIINKTVLAMEFFAPRLSEFRYVLRTNLSSFYVFSRLLKYTKMLPRTRCYCASRSFPELPFGSGSGFLLSPDLVREIIRNKNKFLNRVDHPDDILIGEFFKKKKIPLLPHARCDFYDLESFYIQWDHIPEEVFHFRIKTSGADRLTQDPFIQSELIKRFYQ